MNLVCSLITAYYFVVIGRIVLRLIVDFGRIPYEHPVRRVEELLGKLVDPVLRPIRGLIPGVPMGNMSLDLSPLILIVGLSILQRVIC
ncbi:MAG: YggT family protein [Acidimicrobiia bacterium]|nr:YggT family protein [Acidimicrobiia bacterium]MDH3471735.1 YggT family protein [Acidimicrobiia bacterium]